MLLRFSALSAAIMMIKYTKCKFFPFAWNLTAYLLERLRVTHFCRGCLYIAEPKIESVEVIYLYFPKNALIYQKVNKSVKQYYEWREYADKNVYSSIFFELSVRYWHSYKEGHHNVCCSWWGSMKKMRRRKERYYSTRLRGWDEDE